MKSRFLSCAIPCVAALAVAGCAAEVADGTAFGGAAGAAGDNSSAATGGTANATGGSQSGGTSNGTTGGTGGSALPGKPVPGWPEPAVGTPGIDYLSDLQEEAGATSGWGPFEKDMTNGWNGAGDGCTPIDLFAGHTYDKGIGCHAPVKIGYALAGKYKLFVADVGFTFCETPGGTVVFQVFVDGKNAYDSGLFTKDSQRGTTVNVDVSGAQELQIVVTDGGDGFNYDHVAWAGARLIQ